MIIRENGKIVKDINKILCVIAFASNVIFLLLLLILNALPIKISIPMLLMFIGIDGLLVLFGFVKPFGNKVLKIIYIICSILIVITSVIGSIYLFKTIIFIGDIGNINYKTENYSVIVLNNSSYKRIEDLIGKDFGILNDSIEHINKVKAHIDNKIDINYKNYETLQNLSDDLLNNNIEVIIIEESYKSIIEEYDDKFKENTNVIYTFSTNLKAEDISKSIDVVSKPFSIYISGIDTYGKISSVSRSDVNIVATINPETYKILLISIPRDYYIKLHDTTGYNDKISHAGIYGIDKSVKTVEDLLGIDINYYVKINFTGLIKIVDILDGLDVYSEYTFTSYSGYRFNKGYNNMNGKEALDFARTRKAFATGDRQRGKNQQAVIEALIKKVTNPIVITKYNSLLDSLEGSFETNLTNKEITALARFQLDKMPNWMITSISLNGSDSHEYTYSYRSATSYVMIPYEKSIEKVQKSLSKILGEEVKESSNNKTVDEQNHINDYVKNNSNISLNLHNTTINVGDKVTLRAIVSNYNGKVTWSSSDESIARVSEGVVVALKEGTVTIKAEINGKSDSCIVRINNPLNSILPNDDEKQTTDKNIIFDMIE